MPPSDTFFRDIKVLARKERKDEALRLLRKVASMVKPIMKNRGWKVGLLREFYPKNSALLGMNKNRGQEIMIRLRPHYDDKVFLEFNDILGTMLHELVHIVQGPHDQKFYALLDQLWEEYEKLVDSGFSGDGFESEGIRLGVGVPHNLPPEEARRRALAAAEKRRIQNEIMINPGGVRLGGKSDGITKEMEKRLGIKELARMAAERRVKDAISCGNSGESDLSGEGNIGQEELTDYVQIVSWKEGYKSIVAKDTSGQHNRKREEPSISNQTRKKIKSEQKTEVIILDSDSDVEPNPPPSSSSSRNGPSKPQSFNLLETATSSILVDSNEVPSSTTNSCAQSWDDWECPTCTYLNPPTFLQCEVCLAVRP